MQIAQIDACAEAAQHIQTLGEQLDAMRAHRQVRAYLMQHFKSQMLTMCILHGQREIDAAVSNLRQQLDAQVSLSRVAQDETSALQHIVQQQQQAIDSLQSEIAGLKRRVRMHCLLPMALQSIYSWFFCVCCVRMFQATV